MDLGPHDLVEIKLLKCAQKSYFKLISDIDDSSHLNINTMHTDVTPQFVFGEEILSLAVRYEAVEVE